MCLAKNIYDHKILIREDKPVVENQEPKKSQLGMNEKLIAVDYVLVLYRQIRQRLIDEAARVPKPDDFKLKASDIYNRSSV